MCLVDMIAIVVPSSASFRCSCSSAQSPFLPSVPCHVEECFEAFLFAADFRWLCAEHAWLCLCCLCGLNPELPSGSSKKLKAASATAAWLKLHWTWERLATTGTCMLHSALFICTPFDLAGLRLVQRASRPRGVDIPKDMQGQTHTSEWFAATKSCAEN